MKNSEEKKIDSDEEKREKKEENKGRGQKESDVEKRLAEAEKAAEENLAGWQRTKADFLNYKKSQDKVMEDFRRYANEDMLLSLLPTIDSFDLAVKHLPDDLTESDWVKGIICIKGMFESFLRDAGVSEIEAAGEKFDPNLFEAVGEVESDLPEDTVVEEVQKGYKMGEKIIRPAKVKISRKKE